MMNLNKDYFSLSAGVMLLVLSLMATTTDASMHASRLTDLPQNNAWAVMLKPEQDNIIASLNNEARNELPFPEDETCWQIEQVVLTTRAKNFSLDFLHPLIQQAEGKCLGHKGVTFLAKKLHNELILKGYVTSYIDTPSQDLRSGTLKYRINPGRVGDVEPILERHRYLTLNKPRPLGGNQ